jgi:chemotaxis protein CheD
MSPPPWEPPPPEDEGDSPPTNLPSLFIHPGQLAASATPRLFATILGTCVSVCLNDPVATVGGINHFLLPYGAGTSASGARYGNVALERLFQEVLQEGARRERLQAKVFGGMNSMHSLALKEDLGASNVSFALEWLARHAIPVVAQDVGGDRGRKLLFSSVDGAAWVKRF